MGVLFRVRVDEGLLKSASRVTAEMGLPLGDAVRLFLAQIVKQREIPFKVKADSANDDILPSFERRAKHLDSFYED